MLTYVNTAVNAGLCLILTIAFFAVRNHPNDVCGIRFPCTLEHPWIWKRVHMAAGIAGVICCLLNLYAFLFLASTDFLILSYIGIFGPIAAGCIAAAILRSRQDRQDAQWEEQQRRDAEREESSPRF